MISCPFCKSEIAVKDDICSICNAKKGYLKIYDLILGKNLLIFGGLILPFLFILFALSAQNLFGVYTSIVLTLPMLFAIWNLILGARWFKPDNGRRMMS